MGEKVQKQHIEIGELNSRIKKLTNMADQLKNEYVATKDAMGKEIETAKASNDLSAKQIETLQSEMKTKENEMTILQQSYGKLSQEFTQIKGEMTSLKEQLEQR